MRKALGKGIEALFPGTGLHHAATPERWVPISEIRRSPHQPRQRFVEAKIVELAESIRQRGIIQPLLVRGTGNGYVLIAGERRLRAAERAGLDQVPVLVREATEGESFELALIENVQREDLSPLEEAEAYRRLVEEFGLTQETVAERVGKSRSAVANLLRLLDLPDEVRASVGDGDLTAGHARALLGLPTDVQRIALARAVASRGLSVRQTERLAAAEAARRPRRAAPPPVDLHLRAIQDELCRSLGTRVRVVARRRGGYIQIEYYSRQELNRLVDRLGTHGLPESNAL